MGGAQSSSYRLHVIYGMMIAVMILKTFFVQMLTIVSNKIESASLVTSYIGGSRLGRQFIFCNRKLHHALL